MKQIILYTALKFVLKRRWYDLLESGEKPEEYREITPYWIKRLFYNQVYKPRHKFKINDEEAAFFAQVPSVLAQAIESRLLVPKAGTAVFYLGYAKNRPQFARQILGITVGSGRPEWGATPGKEYLVIKVGEKIQ